MAAPVTANVPPSVVVLAPDTVNAPVTLAAPTTSNGTEGVVPIPTAPALES